MEDIQQENEWVTEQLQRYLTRQGAALPRLLAHADAPAAVECDCLHDLRAVSPETAHGLLRVLGVLPSVLGLRLGHCRPGTLRLGRDAHSAAADSSDDETAADDEALFWLPPLPPLPPLPRLAPPPPPHSPEAAHAPEASSRVPEPAGFRLGPQGPQVQQEPQGLGLGPGTQR